MNFQFRCPQVVQLASIEPPKAAEALQPPGRQNKHHPEFSVTALFPETLNYQILVLGEAHSWDQKQDKLTFQVFLHTA